MGMFMGYSGKVSRYHESGMSDEEIAEELGIGIDTVHALTRDKQSYKYEEDED